MPQLRRSSPRWPMRRVAARSHARPAAQVRTLSAVHFVIMGCGRVGSTLAETLDAARARRSPSSTRRASAFRRLRPTSTAARSRASASTARSSIEAGIERGVRLRRGEQRRQLQHPGRPGGPRDVRRRERRRPDLRPRPGRGLPAARHPHGRHRALDLGPDAAPAAARGRDAGVDRRQRARSGSPRSTSTRAGSGSRSPRSRPSAGSGSPS